jgi:hypothetical protein
MQKIVSRGQNGRGVGLPLRPDSNGGRVRFPAMSIFFLGCQLLAFGDTQHQTRQSETEKFIGQYMFNTMHYIRNYEEKLFWFCTCFFSLNLEKIWVMFYIHCGII